MSATDSQALREIFDGFDLDKNGTISLSELANVAAKLGHSLGEEEAKTIIHQLDSNSDGKISFSEFEYWWVKGRLGKMEQLVYLKARALRMKNFVEKEFSDAKISLKDHKGSARPDTFDIKLQFGEPKEERIRLGFRFYVQGPAEKQLRDKISALIGTHSTSITNKSLGVVFKFPSKDPAFAKVAFEKTLNEILIHEYSPVQSLGNNPFFTYTSFATKTEFVVAVTANAELEGVGAPVTETASKVLDQLGNDFYSKTEFEAILNTTFDDLLDQNPSHNLLKGFSVSFKQEANNSALGKIRKLAESKQSYLSPFEKILTLIRTKHLHLKIRTPQQLGLFMKKMGIDEVVETLPCLGDLLEEISMEMQRHGNLSPFQQVTKQVSGFLMKHVEDKVEVFVLAGELGAGQVELEGKNVTRIHSILFNEA